MSLGLYRPGPEVPVIKEFLTKMITTSESLPGFQITDVLGVMAGVAEKSFTSVAVGNIGMVSGGGLADLVEDAKSGLVSLASQRGANGIVGFRYEVVGRDLEKSVVAYGTAVVLRKLEP